MSLQHTFARWDVPRALRDGALHILDLAKKALVKLSEREIPSIRIGGHQYSFESAEYRRLRALHDSLRALLEQENLLRFMGRMNYVDIVRVLADERRESR